MALLAQIGDLIGLIFLALCLCALAYTLVAAIVVPLYVGPPPTDPKIFPSVTMLKPLHGLEPGLEENLKSFFDQDYPGPIQLVFGVQDPRDPAIAVVNALIAAHPGIDASLETRPDRAPEQEFGIKTSQMSATPPRELAPLQGASFIWTFPRLKTPG